MKANKKEPESDNPKPLNFDHEKDEGYGDRLKKPFMTPEDSRGDEQDEQYHEEEEALSPEEVKKRKEEGTI